MSTCTVCNRNSNTDSNISIKLPKPAVVDERISFVESVCRTLIESRFGAFAAFEPFTFGEQSAEIASDVLLDLSHKFVYPDRHTPTEKISRIARPAALSTICSSPATGCSSMGIREAVAALFRNFLSASLQPRGSPRPVFCILIFGHRGI